MRSLKLVRRPAYFRIALRLPIIILLLLVSVNRLPKPLAAILFLISSNFPIHHN